MPFLIDGNNLMHALSGADATVGREGLCELLGYISRRGEKISVIFDGPARSAKPEGELEIVYCPARSADEVICERIAANTAPRRLVVVSTDRQIRRAARRRRCKIATSEQFAKTLLRAAAGPEKPPPAEPPEKRLGLRPEQTDAWLKEFGLDRPDRKG